MNEENEHNLPSALIGIVLLPAVILHELVHWVFARLYGAWTPIFSIGWSETHYVVLGHFCNTQFRLSSLPAGGYVLVAMTPEAFLDLESVRQIEQKSGVKAPDPVPALSRWKIAIVVVAPLVLNAILSIPLFLACKYGANSAFALSHPAWNLAGLLFGLSNFLCLLMAMVDTDGPALLSIWKETEIASGAE